MVFSIKSLFYPILAGLGATCAFLCLARVLEQILAKTLIYGWRKEQSRYKRRLRGKGPMLLTLALGWVATGVVLSILICGRPVFGLLSLLGLPFIVRTYFAIGHLRASSEMDDSALGFFYVLRGLVESGLALPAALFSVAQGTDGKFSRYLRENLNRYEEGASLPQVLERFRKKNELGNTGVYLGILETVYRSGLSVMPLLDEMVPQLESVIQQRKRVLELRKGVLTQAFITMLIPWILVFVLQLFQPEVVKGFFSSLVGWAVIALSLALEVLGAWVMWNLSEFS